MEILSIVKQSLVITLFVLSMMLLIDYLNVLSKGMWSKGLQSSPWKQVVVGALLGVIPGCLGAYTAVSLYVHNIFGLGALTAAMIATSGDEAFLMFSVIPEKALILHLILFSIALFSGFLVNAFFRNKTVRHPHKHFDLHENEAECICFDRKNLLKQLRSISKVRAVVLGTLTISIGFIAANLGHTEHEMNSLIPDTALLEHAHPAWITITFLVVLSVSLFIALSVNDHFLEEHLWKHIVQKHFLRILLWTFFTLLVVHFLDRYFNLEDLIGKNLLVVLLIAVFIGIVPESGPHFIFVILFASGSLPFSILLANSIVQDGHGSLPLLAESRKGFIMVKTINLAVGFLLGAAGLAMGV
ncbi:MAG: putative manganese transporter [Bacteroidales bacterium]|nr:putative manganese transporter [Bacteroidales bacterium]